MPSTRNSPSFTLPTRRHWLRQLYHWIKRWHNRYHINGIRAQGRFCITDRMTGTRYLFFAHEIYKNKALLKRLEPRAQLYIERIVLEQQGL